MIKCQMVTLICASLKKVCTKLGNFSVSFFHLQFKFTDIVYCCAPLLTAFHEGYQVNK